MFAYAVENLQRLWFTGVKRIKIKLPKHVAFIVSKLYENGYEAFAVGGCVRDAVMGRTPHDWDITTSARPEQVKAIFKRTIDTGIKHGTVTVMLDHIGYEVTTYRIDGEYTDGRHPKEVLFTSNLVEDLKRRDFTINAMAYNDTVGIVDEFGGIEDLKAGIIRCVGVAEDRFTEDALRILRAIRFGAQLGFEIEENTFNAIKKLACNLSLISKERIQAEITKLIMSESPEKITNIYRGGLVPYIFKNTKLEKSAEGELFGKVSDIMRALSADSYLRYAGLLTYEDMPEAVLRDLKLDNKTIKTVSRLVKYKDYSIAITENGVRHAVVEIGQDVFLEYYLPYREALISTGNEKTLAKGDVEKIQSIYETILSKKQCLSVSELAIRGADLKDIGICDGKMIGIILKALFESVLNEPEINEKLTLLDMAKAMEKELASDIH